MILIKVYNKDGTSAYPLPYEYTNEAIAIERANALNVYWQSTDRVIKGDKLYAVTEEHFNEVMQSYGLVKESSDSPVPRQFRRTVPVRSSLRTMERTT